MPFCKTLSDTIPVTARQLQAALEKLPTPLNCRANKGCTTLADWQARLDKLLLELAAEQAPQLVPEVRFCALAVVLGAWSQNLSRTRRHFFFFSRAEAKSTMQHTAVVSSRSHCLCCAYCCHLLACLKRGRAYCHHRLLATHWLDRYHYSISITRCARARTRQAAIQDDDHPLQHAPTTSDASLAVPLVRCCAVFVMLRLSWAAEDDTTTRTRTEVILTLRTRLHSFRPSARPISSLRRHSMSRRWILRYGSWDGCEGWALGMEMQSVARVFPFCCVT